MKKLIYILSFFAAINATAQTPVSLGSMMSNNQQLIEDAVSDGIFILRRYYQLQDTTERPPQYYGRDNRSYFGETYSLGIKCREGYYISDRALRPWEYDRSFKEYIGSKYVPVVSTGEYRMLKEPAYKPLPHIETGTKEVSTRRVYLTQDRMFLPQGFSMDNSDGIKRGWLVWIVTDKPLEEQNDQPASLVIYRTELNFEPGEELYEVKDPAIAKTILGGFYILPEVTGTGQITFHLTGILHRESGKWQVVRLNHSANTHVPPSGSAGSGLTRVPKDATDDTKQNKRR